MPFDVQGKRALVTGASSGIGAALAEALCAAGATVGICARRRRPAGEQRRHPVAPRGRRPRPPTVEAVMRVNDLAPVRLTLALLPHLRERDEARVVNVSSIAAVLSSPGEAAYDASKAALTAFGEAMAIDLWDTNVRVLTVYPGLVDTELSSLPGNDPVPAGVEAIPVGEVVDALLGALARDEVEVYVPAWFKDVALGKLREVAGFMAGSAPFVRGAA